MLQALAGAGRLKRRIYPIQISFLIMFLVCRHVIISKCAVSYWLYSYTITVFSTFNLQVPTTGERR